ncbi:nucleotidyltransferase [Candidatus Saccharibacteria bacterium]|nr:nucleotidyltransferase [Candidatus Saccharibacteria bacterium]
MQKVTLVIMAAGIGSRFGEGIKQLTSVGPSGEIIVDYSIHDAIEAGFNKIIFVIRKDIHKTFEEIIGHRISKKCQVEYAFQELEDLPRGFSVPSDRIKPWGTGQAVLACKDLIHEPFAVINADDYYGKEAFVRVHDFLVEHANDKFHYCMPGFILKNTLSEQGGVSRGICQVDKNGNLTEIIETHNIVKKDKDIAVSEDDGHEISMKALSSMNMWGVTPDYLGILEKGFTKFLKNIPDGDIKAEYLLPVIMGELIAKKKATISVLKTHDKWFGITYAADKEKVISEFAKLVKKGVYETPLNA